MADFKTHMTVSTVTGAVLSFAGFRAGLSWDTCAVAGCLCSVSGMLPDLDSNSGRPLREATALGAAVVPMLMVERLQRLQLQPDTMVLIAIGAYLAIRFVMAEIFRRYTVHRGMWHSLPAAAVCGMLAFLVMSHEDLTLRTFKTTAVVLGFLSHLILDELWSVDFRKGSYKFKESFGTALKLWGGSRVANLFVYSMVVLLGLGVYTDHGITCRNPLDDRVPHTFSEMYAHLKQRLGRAAEGPVQSADHQAGQQANAGQQAFNSIQQSVAPSNLGLPTSTGTGGSKSTALPLPAQQQNSNSFGLSDSSPSPFPKLPASPAIQLPAGTSQTASSTSGLGASAWPPPPR
jgi:membrane-bound metal-dependent hydrolase YbcI (DUF457 family)